MYVHVCTLLQYQLSPESLLVAVAAVQQCLCAPHQLLHSLHLTLHLLHLPGQTYVLTRLSQWPALTGSACLAVNGSSSLALSLTLWQVREHAIAQLRRKHTHWVTEWMTECYVCTACVHTSASIRSASSCPLSPSELLEGVVKCCTETRESDRLHVARVSSLECAGVRNTYLLLLLL